MQKKMTQHLVALLLSASHSSSQKRYLILPSDGATGRQRDESPTQDKAHRAKFPGLNHPLTIITQFYPPDYAATGQFVHELASALVEKGYPVSVFTGKPSYAFTQDDVPKEEWHDGVLIRRTRASQISSKRIRGKLVNSIFFWLRCAVKLRNKVARGSHLLITSAPPYLGLVGWFYHKIFGHTYSCLIYDMYPEVAVRLSVVQPDRWIVSLWEAINTKVWQRASALIVLNEPMKQVLVQRNPELADKVHVIHSWADPDLIKPMPKERNWFAQDHDLVNDFVVLYSGNLGRCHDEITILRCLYLLRREAGIKFVFIGDGAGSITIREAIATGDIPNVIMLPYQDHEVLPFSLTACDLSLLSLKPNMDGVVAPSKFYGMLAAGRPVAAICESGSYIAELVKEGNCGNCFSNGNAEGLAEYILRLKNNSAQVNYLGKNARTYFEQNFTLEKAIPQYLKALGLEQPNLCDVVVQSIH